MNQPCGLVGRLSRLVLAMAKTQLMVDSMSSSCPSKRNTCQHQLCLATSFIKRFFLFPFPQSASKRCTSSDFRVPRSQDANPTQCFFQSFLLEVHCQCPTRPLTLRPNERLHALAPANLGLSVQPLRSGLLTAINLEASIVFG
jgi:hypothetical protein